MTKQIDKTLAAIRALPVKRKISPELHVSSADLKDLVDEYESMREMLEAAVSIDGKNWSISHNGNPANLYALRQFTDKGDLLSYTHHATPQAAFKALQANNEEES